MCLASLIVDLTKVLDLVRSEKRGFLTEVQERDPDLCVSAEAYRVNNTL